MPIPPAFRPPQIDLATVLKQPNPYIDLRISDFHDATRMFTKAVAAYKDRALAHISDAGAAHATESKTLSERIKLSEAELSNCKVKEIQLLADLEKEQEERRASELAIGNLKRRLTTLRSNLAEVSSEVEHYRAITTNLSREQDDDRHTLNVYAEGVCPELCVIQESLSCVIEGIESDQLLIRFFNVDESDAGREMSFVIDVSTQVYRVLTTNPPLLNLSSLVEKLNRSRDIYRFIISMRLAFQQLIA